MLVIILYYNRCNKTEVMLYFKRRKMSLLLQWEVTVCLPIMDSASKCTVLSVFYTESRVKIRSTDKAVKNTEVASSESDAMACIGVQVRFY